MIPTELAEERRLAYVGITRARERLYLSRALVRSAWGQPMTNPASRFLGRDPGPAGGVARTEPDAVGTHGPDHVAPLRPGDSAQAGIAAHGMRTTPFKGWQDTPSISLDVGDRVSHDKYGLGTVVAAEGSGPRATATIDFGTAGTIRLMLIGSVPLVKL